VREVEGMKRGLNTIFRKYSAKEESAIAGRRCLIGGKIIISTRTREGREPGFLAQALGRPLNLYTTKFPRTGRTGN
jgi:hypothetical protein